MHFYSFANFRGDLIGCHSPEGEEGALASSLGGEASGAGEGLVREARPQVPLDGSAGRKCSLGWRAI